MMALNPKIIVLAFVSAGLAFTAGYFLNLTLARGGTQFFIAAAAAVLYLTAVAVRMVLLNNKWLMFSAAGLDTLALLAASYRQFSLILVLALLGVLALMAAGSLKSKSLADNSFKVSFWHIALPSISFVATGLALLAAVLYVGTLNFQDPVAAKSFIAGIIRPVEPLVQNLTASLVPAPVQSLAGVNQLLSTEKLTDLVYQSTIKQFVNLPPLYQNLGLAGIGLLVFLTIKSFLFVINYAAVILGQLIFKILKALKFFTIETENVPKETIRIS